MISFKILTKLHLRYRDKTSPSLDLIFRLISTKHQLQNIDQSKISKNNCVNFPIYEEGKRMRICKLMILTDNVQFMERDGRRRKTEMEKKENKEKRDKVNSADSAFILLIIFSQNQWSGWSGRRRWSCLVWSLLER